MHKTLTGGYYSSYPGYSTVELRSHARQELCDSVVSFRIILRHENTKG